MDCLPVGDLERKLALGRPLRVKFGVDPTAPDIHLGHTVPLLKLREFQDQGHTVVLIIGDWTARVGDPSGRSATRPLIDPEAVEHNAATYADQAFRILDPERTEVRRNGEWFAQMGLSEVFRLAGSATVNQILHRKDFAERLKRQQPVSMLEMLYPLMQAYDSVRVGSDVEIGGTDQLFNLMMARDLQGQFGAADSQSVLTMPLLVGVDGAAKMSKSLGNQIGVTDAPEEQFGRVMRLPDEAMPSWFEILAPDVAMPPDPLHAKRELARLIVARSHGQPAATEAQSKFDHTVSRGEVPEDAPSLVMAERRGEVHLPALITEHLGVASRNEARRLIGSGAVSVDGRRLTDLDVPAADLIGGTLRVGRRRYLRIA
ncbi:tyrosine--tRNA ligase [Miltoncostaea oceani]|uniref:tyrosine--tRNA ligase n=1 Tax=Miltoncostaea oceani TaxID=2843216 RepID=UPI001FE292B0|nr:tyrosine--tRNA ligase [Miltoncostaea oceani]